MPQPRRPKGLRGTGPVPGLLDGHPNLARHVEGLGTVPLAGLEQITSLFPPSLSLPALPPLRAGIIPASSCTSFQKCPFLYFCLTDSSSPFRIKFKASRLLDNVSLVRHPPLSVPFFSTGVGWSSAEKVGGWCAAQQDLEFHRPGGLNRSLASHLRAHFLTSLGFHSHIYSMGAKSCICS